MTPHCPHTTWFKCWFFYTAPFKSLSCLPVVISWPSMFNYPLLVPLGSFTVPLAHLYLYGSLWLCYALWLHVHDLFLLLHHSFQLYIILLVNYPFFSLKNKFLWESPISFIMLPLKLYITPFLAHFLCDLITQIFITTNTEQAWDKEKRKSLPVSSILSIWEIKI